MDATRKQINYIDQLFIDCKILETKKRQDYIYNRFSPHRFADELTLEQASSLITRLKNRKKEDQMTARILRGEI